MILKGQSKTREDEKSIDKNKSTETKYIVSRKTLVKTNAINSSVINLYRYFFQYPY